MSQTSVDTGLVRWPRADRDRYRAAGHWTGRPIGARLAEVARRTPDEIALVDGPIRMTFGELLSRADGAAMRLRALGVRPGDPVVVQLPNCWEHVVVTLAGLRLGAPPVWMLPQHRLVELSGVRARTGARVVVVPGRHRDFDHEAMAHEIFADGHVVVTGPEIGPRGIAAEALLAPADRPADLDEPDARGIAVLKLSGGTTGDPKLVPRTHDDLGYMMRRAAEVCGVGPDTVYLAVLPLGHGFPNTGPGVLGTLLAGGRVVIGRSPTPEAAFAAIAAERVTMTSVVPAVLHRWLEQAGLAAPVGLRSLRLIQVGAARLEPQVAATVPTRLGATLQQVYGMAEGLLCLTRPDDPASVVEHTQGRPISPDDEILIAGEDGRPVAPGESGLLLTRGPYTIRGYYRSPETNRRAFVGAGWYDTGDLARLTPDGNVVLTGREKDLINRGGEKVSAEEIEDLTRRVAGVEQVAAVAMPDAELGERICLVVVPAAAAVPELPVVREELTRAGLAAFKLPERLVLMDSLPLTGMGKVDKRKLRALVAAPPSP